jgi:hypothetical protein
VTAESSSVFRTFRVLWFPMSLNAVLLAALAVILFWVVSWLACAVAADRGMGPEASRAFLPAARAALLDGTWPGFAVAERDGRTEHAVLHEDGAGPERVAAALAEKAQLEAWFPNHVAGARDRMAATSDPEARRAIESRTLRGLGRYRVVFAVQVLAALALLATFGVGICRIYALRMARDEYASPGAAFAYAWSVKTTALLLAPAVLAPMLGIAVLIALAGLFGQIPYVGWLLGALGFPLLVLMALLLVLIAAGGVASLGLVPAAVAIERRGTYDSLGKAFNYVFARPLPLLLHLVVIAAFVTILHRVLIEEAWVERAVALCLTPVFDWMRYSEIAAGATDRLAGFAWFCAWLYKVTWIAWRILVHGALIAYILGAFTALFFVLRQEVDGIDPADVAEDRPAA